MAPRWMVGPDVTCRLGDMEGPYKSFKGMRGWGCLGRRCRNYQNLLNWR